MRAWARRAGHRAQSYWPALWLLAWLWASRVEAAEYEVFIAVEDETDLYELVASDQISEATYLALIDLMASGVELDHASREELYALPNLSYADVDRIVAHRSRVGVLGDGAQLVAAGVLTRAQVAALAPFIRQDGAATGEQTRTGDAASATRREPPRTVGGEPRTTSGDTRTTPDDARTTRGDAPTTRGDARTTRGDAPTTRGDAPTPRRDRHRGRRRPVHGRVRAETLWTSHDRRAPPVLLQARVHALHHLSLGVAASLTRNRLGPVRFDPNRQALLARAAKTRVAVPKAFIQWSTPTYAVVAGTYRAGFGQRLTFDNSGRSSPNGLFVDDAAVRPDRLVRGCRLVAGELVAAPCDRRRYVTADYRFSTGLLGLAAGLKHLEIKAGWLQLYGFFSYQPRDLGQSEVLRRGSDHCEDPRVRKDPSCRAPGVYQAPSPRLSPAPGLSGVRLPNVLALMTFGANASWFYDARTHAGVTGYGAVPRWLVRGANLDVQEWSALPYGGPFGALGVDGAWGRGHHDLFAELARSFDGELGPHGGFAALVRHTASWRHHELDTSVRYYGPHYNNPFARPIAAADQSAGVRARDEAGLRLRYTGKVAQQLGLRATLDGWSALSVARPQLRAFVRADADATPWLQPGLWLRIHDRDVRHRGAGQCFYGNRGSDDPSGDEDDPQLEAFTNHAALDAQSRACTGERYALGTRLGFVPHRRVWLAAQYSHAFAADPRGPAGLRQDAHALVALGARPIDALVLTTRWAYRHDDLAHADRFERSLWGYVAATVSIRPWLVPRVRYDLVAVLDGRTSTRERVPNPEHWLWLQLASRF